MIKLILFVILFVEVVFGAAVFDDNTTNITLRAKFNLVSMLERNNAEVLDPLTLVGNAKRPMMHVYTADLMLGDISDSYVCNRKEHVVLFLEYPGIDGTVISLITINVLQSSTIGDGDALIISGGVGQKHAVIMIDSPQTTFLKYVGLVFGHLAVNK